MLAVSDAVLALAGVYAMVRLWRSAPADAWVRGPALVGLLIISVAALLGALRFAGLETFTRIHVHASNLGALMGLPLLMLAVVNARVAHSGWLPQKAGRAVQLLLLLLVLAIGILTTRLHAGVLAILLPLFALLLSPRPWLPLLLLPLLMFLMAWVRGVEVWPLEIRLTAIHAGLIVILALSFWSWRPSAAADKGAAA